MDISIGLVRTLTSDGLRWLAIWDPRFKYLDFFVTDRIEEESARESITREVGWQLMLDRHRDYLVSNMAQANMEFTEPLPGQMTPGDVKAAFYNVEIYKSAALKAISEDSRCCWLTSQEICQGVANDGRELNPLLVFLVNRSQVIQPWESSVDL